MKREKPEQVLQFGYSEFPGENTARSPGLPGAKGKGAATRAFILVSGGSKEQCRACRLAAWNSLSWLWGIGTVPRCLVPGPGVLRAGVWWPRV